MPNYCQSKLVITGETGLIHQLENERFSREDHLYFLDFEKVVPMPKSLNIEKGSTSNFAHGLLYPKSNEGMSLNDALRTLAFWRGSLPDNCDQPDDLDELIQLLRQTERGRQLLLLGHKCQRNLKLYGYMDWYDWRIDHWGTKWNCSDFSTDDVGIYTLSTAWSPPTPVIAELATLYPSLRFKLSCIELGMWYAGEAVWENGRLLYDADCDVKEMAMSTFGYSEEDFAEDDVDEKEAENSVD